MLYLPASPLTDPVRLAAIEEAGLLDRPLDRSLDRLCRLGATILRAPMTNITLVERDRQVVLSHYGIPEPWASQRTTPLESSFCQHVVRSGEPLVIEDARKNPLVSHSSLIRDWGVVAYAGLPWSTPDGQVQGAYCAMDVLPRSWTKAELTVLQELADMVTDAVRQTVALRRASSAVAPSLPIASPLWEHPLLGIYVIDGDRFANVNPRFAEIFGYSRSELLGLADFAVLIAEDDRDRVTRGLRGTLVGDTGSALQRFEGRGKGGKRLWLETYASRTTERGTPVIVGTLYDIGDWKDVEAKLDDCEDRRAVLLRATNDFTAEWEIGTGSIDWDEKAHRVLRYPADEIGRGIDWWIERLHPEERERVTTSLQRLLRGTESFWTEEYRLRRGDGEYLTLLNRASLVRNRRGMPTRLIHAMIDVTERRRVEDGQRLLARASAVLEDALSAAFPAAKLVELIVPDFADFCVLQLIAADEEGIRTEVRHADPEVAEMLRKEMRAPSRADPLGWLVAEATDQSRAVLLPSFDVDSLSGLDLSGDSGERLRALRPTSLMALPFSFHDRVLGSIVYGMSDSGRHFDSADLVLAKDLVERVAMAVGGRQLYRQARQALNAREDVISVVSHDLRNPLGVITMAIELLRDLSPDRREENRRWLETIRHSAKGMNSIIEDLLDLSRIDSGHLQIDRSEQEVNELLQEVRKALMPLAVQADIQLEFIPLATSRRLFADASKVQRVFANIIGNALKFTPKGGRIEVRAELAESEVRFSVKDTGPGIPSDHLGRVFDRYWQAREGDRRGVGMGLAISRGIVDAHGGRIWAESPPGEGATFWFTLPIEPE
jgi:PAS domain S-box-containing protein